MYRVHAQRSSLPHHVGLALALAGIALLTGCQGFPSIDSWSSLADGGTEFGSAFRGSFTGDVNGAQASLSLQQNGPWLQGTVELAGETFELVGTIKDGRARGRMLGLQTFQSSAFEAERLGSELVLVVPGGSGSLMAEPRRFTFQASPEHAPAPQVTVVDAGNRMDAVPELPVPPPSAPSTGAVVGAQGGTAHGQRDAGLVGAWARSESFGGGSGYGAVVRETLTISGDGTFVLGPGDFAGGGPAGSGRAYGGEPSAAGRWATSDRVVYVSDEGTEWEPYARYYLEDGKLMFTFSDGTRQVWYRS